ncbi:MAG: molybdopterin molybdotransferase MoeA, partial [Acidobacteria bacterium]|nr:molybdopterin molybdotransferase MoeA [Acidobacteriota bacterium]
MLSPEEAWRRLEPWLRPLPPIARSRREALDAVLARRLAATSDLPQADVSALDGFALASDLEAGAELPILGVVAAGDPPGATLSAGAALRIMTGAPVPVGADRVVAVERTETRGDRVVLTEAGPEAGHAIRRRGEVLAAGSTLLEAGARLGPAALSLLASQGIDRLEVHRAPRVAVLATGDEVVPPDEEPPPGGLRDSHTDLLLASGRRLGLRFDTLGIARDDPEELETRLRGGLEADVLLTCGGVSAGEFDHSERVLARLGATFLFDAVAIRPGKPLVAARRGETLVFGLPGNPASVLATFRLFVVPALDRLRGGDAAFWSDAFAVELAGALPAGKGGRDRFVPARLEATGATPRALPVREAGSHDLAAWAGAELMLRVRADDPARGPGDLVEAIR